MDSKKELNHKSKQETMTVNESGPQTTKEQVISSMVTTLQDFNGATSRIMDIAHKAGIVIKENDLKELSKLSEETVSAQKKFLENILRKKELKEEHKKIIENGEGQRASTITKSLFEKSKKLINNKSFQKLINHTPYVGDFVMISKMLRGKEGDKKLTAREYLFYSASVLSAAISFYYLTQGDHVSTGVALSVSEVVSYVDSSIGIMKDVSVKLMAKDSKLSGILSAVSDSFNKGKNMLGDISADVAYALKQSFTPNYAFDYIKNEERTA